MRAGRAWLAALIPAAGGLYVLGPGLLLGQTPLLRDLHLFFHPWTDYLVERVASGEIPLWNPLVNGGSSLAGRIAGRLYYPTFPLYLVVPYRVGVLIDLWLHVAAAGLFAALLLRRLGAAFAAQAVGATLAGLNGWTLAKLEAPMKIGVITFLPLALLAFALAADDRPRRAAAALAAAIALQLLSGYPPLAAYVIPAELIAGVVLLAGAGRGFGRRLVALGGGLAIGVLLASVAIVPFLEEARFAAYWKPLPEQIAIARSLHPAQLWGACFPRWTGLPGVDRFWGRELGVYSSGALYVGLPALLLALAALLTRRRRAPRADATAQAERLLRRQRFAAIGLGVAALLALLVAIGHYGFLFRLMRGTIPIFARTRWPSQALAVVAAVLPLLAALGLQAVTGSDERRAARRAVAALSALFGAVLVAAAWWPALGALGRDLAGAGALAQQRAVFDALGDTYLRGDFLRGGLLGLLASVILLLPRRFAWSLALVMVVDLGLLGRTLVPFTPADLFGEAVQTGALASVLEGNREALRLGGASALDEGIYGSRDPRVFREAKRSLLGSTHLPPRIPLLNGANPLQTAENAYLVGALSRRRTPPAIRKRVGALLGIGALIEPSGADPADPASLGAAPDTLVYRRAGAVPLPEAYVVGNVRVVADADEQIARLGTADFDPSREALVAEPIDGFALAGNVWEGAACELRRPRAERIEVSLRTPGDALLLIRESYHPGWRARVDGVERGVRRANYLQLAVPVRAGESRVELWFAPASVAWGRGLTVAGLLALLAVALPRRRR